DAGQIERADPGNLTVPGRVQRVILFSLQEPFSVRVLPHEELDGLLDLRPQAAQEGAIRSHLVLAVSPQNGAGLAVVRDDAVILGPIVHRARVWMESNGVIDPLARVALKGGKHPGQALRVLPNMRAGAVTAVRALEGIKPAVREMVTGRRGDTA